MPPGSAPHRGVLQGRGTLRAHGACVLDVRLGAASHDGRPRSEDAARGSGAPLLLASVGPNASIGRKKNKISPPPSLWAGVASASRLRRRCGQAGTSPLLRAPRRPALRRLGVTRRFTGLSKAWGQAGDGRREVRWMGGEGGDELNWMAVPSLSPRRQRRPQSTGHKGEHCRLYPIFSQLPEASFQIVMRGSARCRSGCCARPSPSAAAAVSRRTRTRWHHAYLDKDQVQRTRLHLRVSHARTQ